MTSKPRLPGPGAPPPRWFKRLLFLAGSRAPDRLIYGLRHLFNYVHLGWWIKRRNFPVREIVKDRFVVFDRMAAEADGRSVLYLEFGVAEGDSLRYWSGLLAHPNSALHGFDSFEGLPTDWQPGWPEGAFTRGGQLPNFADERVTLFPGWFSDTLPRYQWPDAYEQLIVNLDADLYSSTRCVLDAIEQRIKVGTILYFDQFHHYADELKAFSELLESTGWRFEILATTPDFAQLAFTRVL